MPDATPDLLYAAHDLRQCYGAHVALDLPAFTLHRGDVVALTGYNGAGKSTLLRLLAFLERPTHGTLRYYGGPEPRREITLLLQAPYLLQETVFDNVTLGLRLRGQRDRAHLAAAYAEAMQAVGFATPDAFSRRAPQTLSGGEQQRVALAARLVLQPAVLLLDEPTSNVDAASARALVAAVAACRARGTSVVCATHDRVLLAALDARAVHLSA